MNPTEKPTIIINNPIVGFFAINRNAASPIVDVKAATTEPKETFPLAY